MLGLCGESEDKLDPVRSPEKAAVRTMERVLPGWLRALGKGRRGRAKTLEQQKTTSDASEASAAPSGSFPFHPGSFPRERLLQALGSGHSWKEEMGPFH